MADTAMPRIEFEHTGLADCVTIHHDLTVHRLMEFLDWRLSRLDVEAPDSAAVIFLNPPTWLSWKSYLHQCGAMDAIPDFQDDRYQGFQIKPKNMSSDSSLAVCIHIQGTVGTFKLLVRPTRIGRLMRRFFPRSDFGKPHHYREPHKR